MRLLMALCALAAIGVGRISNPSYVRAGPPPGEATASGSALGTSPAGAIDGQRFSLEPKSLWRCDRRSGWWQIRFPKPQTVGAILQIHGDSEFRFHNAPRNYAWQHSSDGKTWHLLGETVVRREKRLFRLHRLEQPIRAQFLRLNINLCDGDAPVLREVEFYPSTNAAIAFPEWVVAVSSQEDPREVETGLAFVRLARRCKGWEKVSAQALWHGDFNEAFVAAEPRPLCAFLSGSTLEWCQCSREPWRGVQEVLKKRNLPMWGACGGAQVLAILEETGVDRPWDCPRCRGPKKARLPIYSHIGHTAHAVCGDYSKNIGERGKYRMLQVAQDPVLAGLPRVFEIMESHIGQITYPPKGWVRIVTKGPGAHTVNQCIRVKDRYIYAAQFHMEMAGTPKNSRLIMSNFLRLARQWGGYNPSGKAVAAPREIAPEK
jgi:GMP synthase-like glutamine amidotransferase